MPEAEPTSRFLFTVCQPGAEGALKREVEIRQPEYRFSFSRPGFVTFKIPDSVQPAAIFQNSWTFARTRGISLGKVCGDQLGDMAQAVWALPELVELVKELPMRDIHVWQRDLGPPGQNGIEPGPTPLATTIEEMLQKAAPKESGKFRAQPKSGNRLPSRPNQPVLDVVVVEPGEWWIGWHQVQLSEHSFPGGVMPLEMPPHAVSRAYLKMDEALRWSRFPLRKDDEWVEIGCAPGGASQALLDRGQFVTGVDPADVDPVVLEQPHFRHLKMRGFDIRHQEFRDVQWLAVDVNATPTYTLDLVEDIVTSPQAKIRGMVLTLKLTDWLLAEKMPEFIQRIRKWGFHDIRARQLAFNAQELCIVALQNRGLRRLRGEARSQRANRPRNAKSSKPTRRSDSRHQKPSAPHF